MLIETATPEETEAVGARLAGRLVAGDVVLVGGELGTGKTTFVRGACRALGVRDAVTSPSFTIGQLYRAEAANGPLDVAHLDLYRLETLAPEDPGFLDDYVTPDRIAFIEWPDREGLALGDPAAIVTIRHRGGDLRSIEIE